MAHYALVDSSGHVVNTVVWDGTSNWSPPAGLTAVLDSDARVGPGWLYSGGVFTNPNPPPAPPAPIYSCQLWQLQAVMTSAQWAAAQSAVAALNDPKISAFFAHGTNSIPSTSTTLLALGEAIGLTSAQIVALVQEASTVAIP
jgi:hypothetical protein